jgi:hypothetical protein
MGTAETQHSGNAYTGKDTFSHQTRKLFRVDVVHNLVMSIMMVEARHLVVQELDQQITGGRLRQIFQQAADSGSPCASAVDGCTLVRFIQQSLYSTYVLFQVASRFRIREWATL